MNFVTKSRLIKPPRILNNLNVALSKSVGHYELIENDEGEIPIQPDRIIQYSIEFKVWVKTEYIPLHEIRCFINPEPMFTETMSMQRNCKLLRYSIG